MSLLRDLVIDPRNDIEHSYALATEDHARRACDVAQLFLDATEDEAERLGIAALGWNVNYHGESCDKPGQEYEKHEFTLTHQHKPMLLIDSYSLEAEVFIINPKDELLSICPRALFDSSQLIELNSKLRKCLDVTSYGSRHFGKSLMKTLRDQLRL